MLLPHKLLEGGGAHASREGNCSTNILLGLILLRLK
jgi:hypothetical protein